MPNRWEDRIRTFLAEHIELLEPGLSLVSEEYRLPNPIGAGGKVDLLAKDPFGHWVIVEVKRSNQAARQALNEIHKYTALFRTLQGLDETRVRVIVVSTEWHELLVPFSEYAATAKYSVMGLSIKALENGTVTHVERVTLAARSEPIVFSRAHSIYLFDDAADRDEKIPRLVKAVEGSRITDYVLLRCDYVGNEPSIVHRYAACLAIVSPLPSLHDQELAEIKKQIKWEDDLDQPDENFLVAVNEAFVGNWASFEIGYPEKLVTISIKWNVEVAFRGGRLGSDCSLFSDAEILRMVKAVEGGSSLCLGKIASPRFPAAWNELRVNLEPIIASNAKWAQAVPLFLNEIERQAAHASVSVSIYSLFNFPMTLFHLRDGDCSTCPHLEIAVDCAPVREVRILISVLAWNGKVLADPPSRIMKRIYGSFDQWTWKTHFHETRDKEDKAMSAHGFSTPVVEMVLSHNQQPQAREVTISRGMLVRTPLVPGRNQDVSDFVRRNGKYLDSLQKYLRARIGGI